MDGWQVDQVGVHTVTSEAVDSDVADAQSGDESAFDRFYRSIVPGLLRYVSALSAPTPKTCAPEAWLQACRDLHRFSGDLPAFRRLGRAQPRHRRRTRQQT